MSNSLFFKRLFKYSKQVTPYLNGQIKTLASNSVKQSIIQIEYNSSEVIRNLYDNLKHSNPEAGAAYWLTRTWDLLCWQPIYTAFISIYACRGLPQLSSIAQHVQEGYIAGYQLQSQSYIKGTDEELILEAGKELNKLFNYFRNEINSWTRIRPGFTAHLFADAIFGCLVKLSQFYPSLSEQYLLNQAQLWLKACNLPEKLLKSLNYNKQSKELVLVRTSCCLVYKCQGQNLCSDCPRAWKSANHSP
ncbi:siderophore ferric iron reductase [Photobacterium phosphoreum]|uniref:siderophore ferric iron reductase n=1 Tax=Photobacterium phosphoreum TaxID=659 RepID=UPI000D17CB09|nr:siderophore ferric iron reductase [Photobacterium phosphoreum]PSU81655.1 siderophore ferric iron reductase [Photobacterium phosphoreum]